MVWLSVPRAEVRVTMLLGVTLIVPLVVTVPQPPVRVIVYVYGPDVC